MRLGARTNLALLVLLATAFLTGWLAFAYGTMPARWSLILHASSGVAILLLLPWKSVIARRGLARPRPGRRLSILFSALVIVGGSTFALGYVVITVLSLYDLWLRKEVLA